VEDPEGFGILLARRREARDSCSASTAPPSRRKKDLEQHLYQIEEAKKRDHRKIGKELGLVMFSDLAPASPFFKPKGTIVYNLLQNYIRGLYLRYGYQEVITPQIFDVQLWKTSGHYEKYKENMYFTMIDEAEFAVKPMNCPSHTLIFGSELRSYRDLPIRIADFGRLHRYERRASPRV
jgi:threonyl-tRNA synthetase